ASTDRTQGKYTSGKRFAADGKSAPRRLRICCGGRSSVRPRSNPRRLRSSDAMPEEFFGINKSHQRFNLQRNAPNPRRTTLKTTSHRLVGLLSALAGITPVFAWTLPAVSLPVGVAAAADAAPDDAQQCDDLLRQARKAMADNHFQLADSFISRAEQL